MSDCYRCPVEATCHYPYKPCDCVHQRKYWPLERRQEWDKAKEQERQASSAPGAQ